MTNGPGPYANLKAAANLLLLHEKFCVTAECCSLAAKLVR